MARHGVLSVAMTDRIIGCPHQEGIDYQGPWCPVCEFWKGRDRFTGERRALRRLVVARQLRVSHMIKDVPAPMSRTSLRVIFSFVSLAASPAVDGVFGTSSRVARRRQDGACGPDQTAGGDSLAVMTEPRLSKIAHFS
jgi:hypothetical protein